MSKFGFGRQDFISLGKGLFIALAGAALTYFASFATSHDFGVWTPVVVALASVLVNAARKSLDGVKE